MMIALDLTEFGQSQVDLLLRFEDHPLHLDYYNGDPRADFSGNRWTIGNDALLLLGGDVGDLIIVAPDAESAFGYFAQALSALLRTKGITASDDDLLAVWNDISSTGMLLMEEVGDHELADVPQL